MGKAAKSGFFHIFGAGSINKVITAIVGIVLVRLLTKDAYGVYAYAYNLVSMILLFNGLGIGSAVLQICSELFEWEDKANAVLHYAFRAGIVVELAIGIVIALVALSADLPIEGSGSLLLLYCGYPLGFFLYDLKTIQLRTKLMNKEYAFASNLQTGSIACLSIIGALFFQDKGLVIGQTLSFYTSFFILTVRYPLRDKTVAVLAREDFIDLWKIALISSLNNGLSQALSLIGTFLVGIYLQSDTLVAEYQVATIIPASMMFIPSAFLTYVYPYFARNRNNRLWTLKHYALMLAAIFCIMSTLSAIVVILSPQLIIILFGADYLDIIPALTVLTIAFLFASAFRTPAGSLLVTQRKLLTNTIVSGISIVICIMASMTLIPDCGVMGAAYSFLATMLFSGIAYVSCYLYAIMNIDAS